MSNNSVPFSLGTFSFRNSLLTVQLRQAPIGGSQIWQELDVAGAGYGGNQIQREPKLSTYRGQTLESRCALAVVALLTSHSTSEAHVAHAAGNEKAEGQKPRERADSLMSVLGT